VINNKNSTYNCSNISGGNTERRAEHLITTSSTNMATATTTTTATDDNEVELFLGDNNNSKRRDDDDDDDDDDGDDDNDNDNDDDEGNDDDEDEDDEEDDEEEEEEDDYVYYDDQTIRNNELERNTSEYKVSDSIVAANRTTEQQAQDQLYKDFLPNFWDGGILVFFHLYKTGGSSVTELIVELKEEEQFEFKRDLGCVDDATTINNSYMDSRALLREHRALNKTTSSSNITSTDCQSRVVFMNQRESMTMDDVTKSVWLVTEKKKVVIYNFHVQFPQTMYPTLLEAQPILEAWRAEAKSKNVPIFVATLLREPLGHALSFFNFFHVATNEKVSRWSPFRGDMAATEDNFLATYVPNRLCHMMYDDAHAILQAPDLALRQGLVDKLHHFMDDDELQRRQESRVCAVEKVREVLHQSFDYVGVTEKISDYLLPMTTYLAWGDASWALDAERKKNVDHLLGPDEPEVQDKVKGKDADADDDDADNEEPAEEIVVVPLKKHHLSEATKAKVRTESRIDQQLYEEFRDKYDQWPKYVRTSSTSTSTSSSENKNTIIDEDEKNGTDEDDSNSNSHESVDERKADSESDEL